MWRILHYLLVGVGFMPTGLAIHGFLDDADIFRGPFSQFLNRNRQTVLDNVLPRPGVLCTSAENGLQGACVSKGDCIISGGRFNLQNSQCGLLAVCCTQQQARCGSTSTTKVSTFSNPVDLTTTTSCSHTVRLISRNVCQLRLDFDVFRLASPTTVPALCRDQAFTVAPSLNRIPAICGVNTGQNLYVHVNGSQTRNVQLTMTLSNVQQAALPAWRIRVTQLECAGSGTLLRRGNVLDKTGPTAGVDWPLLAPFDCLQYFTDTSGTFESFNYNALTGPYMAGLDYAICFRKRVGNCGILLTPVQFQVGSTTQTPGYETTCTAITPAPRSPDYLGVPNGVIPDGTLHWIFCDQITATITRTAPGPFVIYFHSDAASPGIAGFQMTYNILNNC